MEGNFGDFRRKKSKKWGIFEKMERKNRRDWGEFGEFSRDFGEIFERFLGDCEGKNEKMERKTRVLWKEFYLLRGKIGGNRIKRQKFYYYLQRIGHRNNRILILFIKG